MEGFATPVAGDGGLVGAVPLAQPSVLDDQAGAANALELDALLQQFKRRLDDPLLPMPDPKVVRRRLFSVARPVTRRSKRIAAKGTGLATSVVKRAQRILMQKLGICRDEDRLSDSQLKEYHTLFASPLGPEQIEAIASLFGLRCSDGVGDAMVEAADA
jgi:hypothetical protein